MMMSEYTPGPWLIERNHDDGSYCIWTRQPHTGELATVMTEDINGEWPVAANARLMAAAPEMLDALYRIANPGKGISQKAPAWAVGLANAAIRKATEATQ